MIIRVRRLDINHDMTFGRGLGNICERAEAVAQKVKTRLYLLQGEWFLDTEAGVPYLQDITTKPVDIVYAESILKKTILETDGVTELLDWNTSLNRATRVFDVNCRVKTIYGTTENIRADI